MSTILFSVIIFHLIIHIDHYSGIIYKGFAYCNTQWYGMVIITLIIIIIFVIVSCYHTMHNNLKCNNTLFLVDMN